jgi:Holliday junction resolvase
MSKSQRTKGAAGEREVVGIINEALGTSFRRKLGQARDGGHDVTLGPFLVEVKRRRKLAVYEFVEQVQAACQAGDRPVVMARADGKGWLVIQPLEDWLTLAREEIVR